MSKKKAAKKAPSEPLFHDLSPQAKQAIGAVVMGVLGVFFLFSLLEAAGPLGRYTVVALTWLLGSGAWLAPVGCAVWVYVLLAPKEDEPVSISKVVGASLFFLTALGALELFSDGLGGMAGEVLAWPLAGMFGAAFAGGFLFGLGLISIFLLFNVGLALPRLGRAEHADETPLTDTLPEELEEEDAEDEEVDIEEDVAEKKRSTGSMRAVEAVVSTLAKAKPNEFVVKNFSGPYTPPPLSLLTKDNTKAQIGDVKANSLAIKGTLKQFGIEVEIDGVERGPTISRYALKPAQGVRLASIVGLQQEIQMALKANTVRIEAPIPGKSLVGIEVPNQTRGSVTLSSLLTAPEYTDSPHPLLVALGQDVTGKAHFTNIAAMPHGLIAGATGAGKSVTIHNIIVSLLYRNSPEQLRLILVDPKKVELTFYKNLPHLLTPVINDAKKALRALSWAVNEMEKRYDILESEQVQNIASYHKKVYQVAKKEWEDRGKLEEERAALPPAMPYIVIILDELNDLMSAYPRELEACIVRLSQKSRAVGIHLILATQRPSVNVITGTIKANVPTRIALAVASQVDSRTIIDGVGAEKLLGKGDMLYLASDTPKPVRIQAAFISEDEIKKVSDFIRTHTDQELETINLDEASSASNDTVFNAMVGADDGDDDMYEEAKAVVLEAGQASTSYLQRKLRVGYSRAARLMDLLENRGVIGPANGSKPREIILGKDSSDTPEENPIL